MQQPNSIKNWHDDDKPREKLIKSGKESLTDAELLAILIATGTPSRSALDLAKDILGLASNNLQELGKLLLPELQKVKGIGEAKAITIAAAMELGRRRQIQVAIERPVLNSAQCCSEVLIPLLADLNYEAFCVLYLNQSSRLLKHELLFHGGISSTIADIRMILKNAILCNASQIVVAHNHPSGSLKPSEADKKLTKELQEACKMVHLRLVDHLIISDNNYFSFANDGLI